MKQINGKWVVGVAFENRDDALAFENDVMEHGDVGTETKFFTDVKIVDPEGGVHNSITGNLTGHGTVFQAGHIGKFPG